jgi:hypothetical protein
VRRPIRQPARAGRSGVGALNHHLIRAVENWLEKNRVFLQSAGLVLDERIPSEADEVPWKASVGFVYENQIVQFTIWQRHFDEAEIIAIDTATGKHFPIQLLTPEQIADISGTLDHIAENVLARGYRDD